jgi:uridine kinase
MSDTLVVGITGGTCSGKSFLARHLMQDLRSHNVSVDYLNQDWYYYDLSQLPKAQRDQVIFDQPQAIDIDLFAQHLEHLKFGKPIVAPSYDYSEHIRLEQGHPITPVSILIVDGLFLLMQESIANLIDIGVYLSVPDDIRLVRKIRRDVLKYGISLEYLLRYYETSIRPLHELYVASAASRASLNLRYWPEQDADLALNILRDSIVRKLSQTQPPVPTPD